MQVTSCGTLVILITSLGEFPSIILQSYFLSFISLFKKKYTVLQDCYWCLSCLVAEGQFQWVRVSQSRLNLNPMEQGQYGQHVAVGNPSSYMSMRDYINQSWQSQQPVERNPNEYRSMRDYGSQWMSSPYGSAYNHSWGNHTNSSWEPRPPQYAPPEPPFYASTPQSPQSPQPPQSIPPFEQAILDLTRIVDDLWKRIRRLMPIQLSLWKTI